LVLSMDAPASADSGAWGVALPHTHTLMRVHTHLNRNAAADRRLSVSDPQTHARRGARARTYVRPRCWRTVRVQSAHASGLRVHTSAQMCVCVTLDVRVCGGCARVRMCVPRLCVFHRPLGCRPASHSSAHLGHRSLFRVRVSSSVFSRAGPRQAKPLRAHL
jgi:hypothetical protein